MNNNALEQFAAAAKAKQEEFAAAAQKEFDEFTAKVNKDFEDFKAQAEAMRAKHRKEFNDLIEFLEGDVELENILDEADDLASEYEMVTVKLGNSIDTNGCTVSQAYLLGSDDENYQHYLLTTEGICVATVERLNGNKYYDSTQLMPFSYKDYIQRNWNIEITDRLLEQSKLMCVLGTKITNDTIAARICLDN